VGYFLVTKEIAKPSWSLFQYDGAAAFKLSERSPLPPSLSAMDLPGGQTQILNVHQIQRINRHPGESYEDSAFENVSDTEDWLKSNGHLDNPIDSEDDCAVDDESDMDQDNSIQHPESTKQREVSAAPNVP
jgi:hypothetical protein